MKTLFRFALLLQLLFFIQLYGLAQAGPAATTTASIEPIVQKLNLVKVNLTALPLRNFALQYERVLNRRLSLGLTYRYMPEGGLPLTGIINYLTISKTGAINEDRFDNFKGGNTAITPELRYYLGRGYSKGFYLAPFYRYARFTGKNLSMDYNGVGGVRKIDLSGNQENHTVGLLLGVQWLLGKSIVLDWQIIGAHYGSGKGNYNGVSATPLTTEEQQNLRDELEALDIPFATKTIAVNASGGIVGLSGQWAGMRSAIQLGIRL